MNSILTKENRGSTQCKIKQIVPEKHGITVPQENGRSKGLLHFLSHEFCDGSLQLL